MSPFGARQNEGEAMTDKQRGQALSGLQRDLGGGLILRWARREDAEAVAAFNARVHFSSGGPFEQREPKRGVAASTRDLMSEDHPTFEALHRWSEERGYLMQAIAGISYYHRRFGYEMAVSMSAGRRVYVRDVAGKLSSGDGDEGFPRSYRLRLALASDAPFLSGLHRRGRGRYLLTSSRDEGLWRYEVVGRDPESDESLEVRIVEDAAGKSVGYVCHTRDLREGTLQVDGYELTNGVSWLEVTPFVLSELAETGRKGTSDGEKLAALTFVLGEHHPLHEAIPEPRLYRLDRHDHYSFYVRVCPTSHSSFAT
jgi:hypothetical protein